MYVRHLSVTDFRSWEQADLDFAPGVSVLVGANGQGKTNLVEAVGYLATLASHRVAGDAPLIRRDASSASIRAVAVNEGRELTVQVEIASGKANRARVNRSPVRSPREVLGIVRTVVFAPGGPRAGPRRPRRAPPFPRRPARRPRAAVGRGAGGLRQGAAPALGPAQDRPPRPRRHEHPRRVGRPSRPRRGGARRRAPRAHRRARPARAGRLRRGGAGVRAGGGALPLARRDGGRPGAARRRPRPRPRRSRRCCSTRCAAAATRRSSAGCASSARTATTSSSRSARARRRGTPATGSRGRWRSRCAWGRSSCSGARAPNPS